MELVTLVAGVERSTHEALVTAGSQREGADELVTKGQGSSSDVGILVEEVNMHVPRVENDLGIVGWGRSSKLRVVIRTGLSRKRREEQRLVASSSILAGRRLHFQRREDNLLGLTFTTCNLILFVQSRQFLVTGDQRS